jgi:hypothetical protein
VTEFAIDKVNGANGSHAVAGANGTNGTKVADPVIDLRETATTRVRVRRDDNPFLALSPSERMKLIIRVLCEIVAYGEVDDDPVVTGPDQTAINT